MMNYFAIKYHFSYHQKEKNAFIFMVFEAWNEILYTKDVNYRHSHEKSILKRPSVYICI